VAKILRSVGRVLITIYLIALHLFAVFLAIRYYYPEFRVVARQQVETVNDPNLSTPVPTPIPVPSEFVEDQSAEQQAPSNAPQQTPSNVVSDAPADQLMIPVKGIRRDQLQDTFTSARSNGRVHDAIDIMAPGGTPVVAATDGEILKFFDSVAGGTTIYELSADKKYIFYYAHLQSRQSGLSEHDHVKRGQVIGYVGDTGNAGPGNYHLHFAIAEAVDPKRWWSGPYLNPYPILRNAIEAP
jgi:murein DD-endopeptidase MepM/ murein hydrolase activator NlpD